MKYHLKLLTFQIIFTSLFKQLSVMKYKLNESLLKIVSIQAMKAFIRASL